MTLYAPSIDKTVKKFELKSFVAHAAVLRSIRAALDATAQAWPYTTRHVLVDNSKTILGHQTLLIATDSFERPLAANMKDVLVV
jgi:hypothetical protein